MHEHCNIVMFKKLQFLKIFIVVNWGRLLGVLLLLLVGWLVGAGSVVATGMFAWEGYSNNISGCLV